MPAGNAPVHGVINTQSIFNAAAGVSSRFSPSNPRRVSLMVQVTGANPGRLRFQNDVGFTGADIVIAAGDFRFWRTNAPLEAINLGSLLGTTFMILEGTQST